MVHGNSMRLEQGREVAEFLGISGNMAVAFS